MRPRTLFASILLAGLAAALATSPVTAAPPPKPSGLLKNYFKARKPEERAAAWKAIEEAPALAAEDVPKLAAETLRYLARTGRRVPSGGRTKWFSDREQEAMRKRLDRGDEKGEYEGLFFASGGSRKGLVLGLHGGGKGSGDAGSAKGAFSGAIGSIKMSGLFPQVLKKTEYGWTVPAETERFVLEVLKRARVSWGVDPNRVYVTGHSMGGFGTWTYLSVYADLFAGGAVFAGGPTVFWKPGMVDIQAEAVTPGYLPNLRNSALFVQQCLDDPRVRPAANQAAIAGLRDLQKEDPEGWKHRYLELDKGGHGFPKGMPIEGLRWMAAHVRDPRPTKIVWQPTRAWKNTFYWLRWEEPWLASLVTATRDPEKNAIAIEIVRPRSARAVQTEEQREGKVRELSVYLDDRVLDIAKEIVITVDGNERYRGIPELRLATLVRSAEEREDLEYVFAAEARMGPPGPESGAR